MASSGGRVARRKWRFPIQLLADTVAAWEGVLLFDAGVETRCLAPELRLADLRQDATFAL